MSPSGESEQLLTEMMKDEEKGTNEEHNVDVENTEDLKMNFSSS